MENINYDQKTKILSMPEDKCNIFPNGIGSYLYQQMKLHPSKVAQIDAITGEKDFYSSFLQRCIRTAIELKTKYNIQPNDVVCICSNNHLNAAVPFIATQLIGSLVASLDISISLDDTKHLLNLVKPKIIFVSKNAEDLIEEAIKENCLDTVIIVFGETQKHVMFDEFIEIKSNEDEFQPYTVNSLEQIAVIAFSSGTTGLAKGICLSHKFLLHKTKAMNSPVNLLYSSLYWISAISSVIRTTAAGSCRLIYPQFDAKLIWKHIEDYKVNFLFLSPSDAINMYYTKPKNLVSELNVFILGGSTITKEYLVAITNAMPKTSVIFAYGSTELGAVSNPFHPILKDKIGSVGLPINSCHYKIVDAETEVTLDIHEIGELRIKSKSCMSGYYKKDSSEAWDEDGFLKTGDIGYFDSDYCLYVIDRLKEMFKYKAWHILPAKIEAILESHPNVKQAVVVGIPHDTDDNHPMAVVIRKEGSLVTANDLQAFVDGFVDERNKLRAGVVFVDAFPVTPNGKIKRRELRDLAKNMYNQNYVITSIK